MEFFFKRTESASRTFLIGFKLKDTDSYSGPKIFLKCWTQNTPNYEALDYEVRVYEQIYRDIFSEYPYAPFLKYYMHGTCSVEALVERIVKTGDIPDEKNNRLKLIRELKNYASENSLDYDTPLISFIGTFQRKDSTFKEYLQNYGNTNKKEDVDLLLFIFAQIIFGLVLLRKNKISHNDLHSSNILIEDKTPYIFDFDRSYSEKIGNNPRCNNLHERNVFDRYPRDYYKLLCYVKRNSDQMFLELYKLLNNDPSEEKNNYSNYIFLKSMYEKESQVRKLDTATGVYKPGGNCWFQKGQLYDENLLLILEKIFKKDLVDLYNLIKNYILNLKASNSEETKRLKEMKKNFEIIESKRNNKEEMKQDIKDGIKKQKESLLQGGYSQVIKLAPNVLLASKSGYISDEKVNKIKKSYNTHIPSKKSNIVDKLEAISKVIDDNMESHPGLKVDKGTSDARILAEQEGKEISSIKFSVPTLPESINKQMREYKEDDSLIFAEQYLKENPLASPTLPVYMNKPSAERKEKSEYSRKLQPLTEMRGYNEGDEPIFTEQYWKENPFELPTLPESMNKQIREYKEDDSLIFAEQYLKENPLASPTLPVYMNKSFGKDDEQPGFKNEYSMDKSFGKDDEQPGFRNEYSMKDENKNRFEFKKYTKNNSMHTKLQNKFSSKNSSGLGKSKFAMVLTENIPQPNLFNRDYSKLSITDDYSSKIQKSNKNMADLFIEAEQMSSPILESDNLSVGKTGLSDSKLEYSYYFDLDLLVVYI